MLVILYIGGTCFDINNQNGYSFILQGTVSCPENVDANGVKLTTQIKIVVAEAGKAEDTTVEIATEATTQAPTIEDETEKVIKESSVESNSEEGKVKNSGNDLWWIWLILACAIITIIIFVILKKRTKDKEKEADSQ